MILSLDESLSSTFGPSQKAFHVPKYFLNCHIFYERLTSYFVTNILNPADIKQLEFLYE